MKEKSESEPSSSPSSVPGPSVPGPSAPGPSAPGEQIIQTISEQEFYALVNSQEEILVKQFNDHREEYAKKDINQVFSKITIHIYNSNSNLFIYFIFLNTIISFSKLIFDLVPSFSA